MSPFLLSFFLLAGLRPPTATPAAHPSGSLATATPVDFWRELPTTQARRLGKARLTPTRYRVFALDLAGLRRTLAPATADSGPDLLLPLPDGSRQLYHLRASTTMAPELAARYPTLRTYAGQSATAPADYVRLEVTSTGLHALLVRAGRTLLIEPYRAGDTQHYICFDKAALPAGSKPAFEIPGGPQR
ncbi:hypothetical protein [Hymenobacter persicinus]|uniref:Uncharacterized protein n=1 Tax=Hymenobacter persicinus TaxID=2025506 RepID=A0A4Q5L7S7_9BACT|nr:hypothetical protein [Hymenobacter persicinus]RYU77652.1 hypothetical protein EWM57_17475 [Hymenobacter persicinus]